MADAPSETAGSSGAGTAAEFFVCYSRRDSATVKRICDSLAACGIACWMDKDSIAGSEVWRRSVVQGIRRAEGVIFFGSAHSYKSEHVAKELTVASEQGKPILPVRIDDSKPSGEFEYLLAGIHRVRYDADQHDLGVREIARGLERARQPRTVPAPTRQMPPAGAARRPTILAKLAWFGAALFVIAMVLLWLGNRSGSRQSQGGPARQPAHTPAPASDLTKAPGRPEPPPQIGATQLLHTDVVTMPPSAPPPPTAPTQVVAAPAQPPNLLQPARQGPDSVAGVPTNIDASQVVARSVTERLAKPTNASAKGAPPAFRPGDFKIQTTNADHGKMTK